MSSGSGHQDGHGVVVCILGVSEWLEVWLCTHIENTLNTFMRNRNRVLAY